MADTTLVVIIVAVVIAVAIVILVSVLFVYCRKRLKKGSNIRRRVVEGEEVVKVRQPPPVVKEVIHVSDELPRNEIKEVMYRPPTPPPVREYITERRGSLPRREPNPEYVIVRKKHHHGRHRRRPSLEADRHIYRTERYSDSSSSSDEDEESGKSHTFMRRQPMPVYTVPMPAVMPAPVNVQWQPYMMNAPPPAVPQPNIVGQNGQTNADHDSTFFWRPTQRHYEYGVGGGDVAFTEPS